MKVIDFYWLPTFLMSIYVAGLWTVATGDSLNTNGFTVAISTERTLLLAGTLAAGVMACVWAVMAWNAKSMRHHLNANASGQAMRNTAIYAIQFGMYLYLTFHYIMATVYAWDFYDSTDNSDFPGLQKSFDEGFSTGAITFTATKKLEYLRIVRDSAVGWFTFVGMAITVTRLTRKPAGTQAEQKELKAKTKTKNNDTPSTGTKGRHKSRSPSVGRPPSSSKKKGNHALQVDSSSDDYGSDSN